MDPAFERARELFFQGVAAFEADRLAEAEAAFVASLAQVPGRPSTLVNLAAVRMRLARPAEALEALDRALAAAPDDVPAWFHRGQTLQALERPADALASYERALALDAAHGAAWSQRGMILKDMGRLPEAAGSFRQALAHGADAELNRYLLASVDGAPASAPASAPRQYVQSLFDSYAGDFDEHLVHKLGYRTPWMIAELLPPGRRYAAALDLGCGTGLMAPLLVPSCGALDGVDLSGEMLRRAARLELYRDLVQDDIAAHLEASARRYELVVAADVFVYVGALDAVFAGVRRVLEPGGLFAFSVEEAGGDAAVGFELRASSRYAHREAYVATIATQHGFAVRRRERGTLRLDQRAPIVGHCWLLGADGP